MNVFCLFTNMNYQTNSTKIKKVEAFEISNNDYKNK